MVRIDCNMMFMVAVMIITAVKWKLLLAEAMEILAHFPVSGSFHERTGKTHNFLHKILQATPQLSRKCQKAACTRTMTTI